jgi:HK97 family phage prohead protease
MRTPQISLALQVQDLEIPADLRSLRIRATPYDTWTNRGWGNYLRIRPHAFDKSIAERPVPLLLFHDNEDLKRIIGKPASWTLDDPIGLIGTWDIDIADEHALEAARKARDGFLTGASVGFNPIRMTEVWNDEDDWDPAVSRDLAYLQSTLIEGSLLELSLTPTPAFAAARVLAGSPQTLAIHPPRDTITTPGMDLDTQLAIRAVKATAARLGAAASPRPSDARTVPPAG